MAPPFTVVIPARLGSTRLPRKPLAEIAGRPLVVHVWERAQASGAARVVVATDHEAVAEAVARAGGEALLTAADHPSGSDRVLEAVRRLDLPPEAVVVNVQGDEPLVPPRVIAQLAAALAADSGIAAATVAEPLASREALWDPNVVKVVRDARGFALYFSRAPIPWWRDRPGAPPVEWPAAARPLRHLGLYAYRREALERFVGWPPAPLESLECLEQLRFLHHGVPLLVVDACEAVPAGVDTPADLERVRRLLEGAR